MVLKLNLKKDELISVAVEMGMVIPSKAKIIDLKKLIESSAVYKNDIEFVRSLVENALEKSKEEAEKKELEAEIQLEKIKLSQIEKQLELAKVRKESEKNPQALESGEPSSITDKLESLGKSIKTLTIQVPVRPHNSLIHFSRDKTRNPTSTSNLNLDASTFVPGQIERSVEANSQSQLVATGFEKGILKNVFLSTVRALVKNKYSQWVQVRCLLDVGSQSCLCTRACAEKLQLKMEKISAVVSCVNDTSMVVKNCVKTSVANKAKTFESFQWNYVPSVLNPADLVSRGLRPCDLPNLRLWWYSPQFLEKDSDGLLRAGGRLSNSDLTYVNKHPAILPGNHNLTVQIIAHFHRKNLHTGASSLLHYVREKFWSLNGRSLCRKVVHECLACFKSRPLVTSQLMGNLPCDRVVPDYPFNCSAIYIEIVSDLTSDAFIATLKRLFSRRGKCAKLYSDNGKTFVGANKELKRFLKLIEDSDDNLAGFLSAEGIEWKFIPPRAPSVGGLWEA
ncbi:integrase catalytic domain-containing protein [Trichonephila clavipes]|uniref:Integrase catalytic domain-containing protein n=1 Tax=Trichonephila clavipes TaxID=2585209 RepID=A0A8X6VTQ5_TRICX|nr:integrase catalytic domain-containing protein [Trichonephila clavipes]